MAPPVSRIGFIGLGAMGTGMAARLVHAGFEVRGFDVRAEAVRRLASAGGRAAASAAEAAADADLCIVMVATAEQADAALFGAAGAVPRLRPGVAVVLSSTVPPDYARRLGQRLEASGHPLLDAPVSGGVVGAESGSLTVMASGPAAAFAAAESALAAQILAELGLGDITVAGREVTAQLGEQAPETVCARLVHAGVPVAGLDTPRASLEDLFVELTGEGFDVDG